MSAKTPLVVLHGGLWRLGLDYSPPAFLTDLTSKVTRMPAVIIFYDQIGFGPSIDEFELFSLSLSLRLCHRAMSMSGLEKLVCVRARVSERGPIQVCNFAGP